MKNRFIRSQTSGFTLVELLVVIGIIAILAAVIGFSGNVALKAAKRAKSNQTASSIQTAVLAYYTDYGVYPVPANAPAGDYLYTTVGEAPWYSLQKALNGNVNPHSPTSGVVAPSTTDVQNTRNITYLQPAQSDLDNNGVLKNPFTTTAAPTYFGMALDTDYSGIVGDSGTAKGAIPGFTDGTASQMGTPAAVNAGVAVWCNNDQTPYAVTGNSDSKFWAHTY